MTWHQRWLLGALGLVLSACSTTTHVGAATQTSGSSTPSARWTIAGDLADCVGVAPMKCMRYRERPDGPWLFFYGPIEGFTFREGEEADVLVRFVTVPNPPADASSRRVVLVQELARRPTAVSSHTPSAGGSPASPGTLAGSSWQLASLGTRSPDAAALARIQLSFDDTGRAVGHSGVNRFSAQAQISGSALSFGGPLSTRMAGSPEAMALESDFLSRLVRTARWRIDGDRLSLSDATGAELMTFTRTAPGR